MWFILRLHIWENLPTAINGTRIFYYVREEAYTLDGTTWYLLKDDGTYKATDGTEGSYKANYEGNAAASGNPAVISINNTSNLRIKKIWLDYNGNVMTDASKIPVSSVDVNLIGTNASTGAKIIIGTYTLISSGSWEKVFTDAEVSAMNLSQYSRLTLEEKTEVSGFSSTSGSIPASDRGEIAVINQDQSSETISVSGKKHWAGDIVPANASVTLTLYRSTTYVTSDNLNTVAKSENKVSDADLVKYDSNNEKNDKVLIGNDKTVTWTKLPSRDASGNRYYYYIVETARTPSDGYMEAQYSSNGLMKNGTVTITNTPLENVSLKVRKIWGDTPDSYPDNIKVEIHRSTVILNPGPQTIIPEKLRLMNSADAAITMPPNSTKMVEINRDDVNISDYDTDVISVEFNQATKTYTITSKAAG